MTDKPFDDICPVCQTSMTWFDCWKCGGEGYYSRFDEDPLWYDEDDDYPCDICDGEGGWLSCPYADEHPQTEAQR